MKVDKEFKKEINQELAETSYVTRRVVTKVIMWIVIVGLILGAVGFGWKYLATNANREIFKQSTTYNEGVLDDLAKYKFEYDTAKDEVEREAIASLVRNRFANYDKSKIENYDLVKFMKECGL